MILGTGSHVGKSLVTTALCRIFHQHGIRVAPFKSQNMSLNSAATPEGLEIGRAQALQAEAAGLAPSVDMNPILIKPSGHMSSQIVVRGRIWGQLTAASYHLRRVEELMPIVRESYHSLAAQHDLILLEGAGSPAEINLKQHDIVNMRMAQLADAACLLVGDIDRGGVFASLLGTLLLLDAAEQQRIRGLIINKFRGDVTLLTPGLKMLQDRTGKPCLGVVPWRANLTLDEEDSLGLPKIYTSGWPPEEHPPGTPSIAAGAPSIAAGAPSIAAASQWVGRTPSGTRRLRIAVLALPSLANFTDFDSLCAEPSVDLRLVRTVQALDGADVLILPGSKQTADDLAWLRRDGLAEAILQHTRSRPLIGVCGGLQMLGTEIADPDGIEAAATVEGLGLLPFRTVMQPAKRTELASGFLAQNFLFGEPAPRIPVSGYEIHIGATVYESSASPFAYLAGGPDGCISTDSRIFGTYLHGIFDDDRFRHLFIRAARAALQLCPPETLNDWKRQREQALNDFAAHVEDSLDMPAIFALAGFPYQPRAGRA
jgi:adenosylcobyric acid synthase